MFLQGTDLNNAFGLSPDAQAFIESYIPENTRNVEGGHNVAQMQQHAQQAQQQAQPSQRVAPGMQHSRSTPISSLPQTSSHVYDSSELHKAMQHEQQLQKISQIQRIAQKMNKEKETFKASEDDSYLDKLWSKKRDITKLLVFTCIVLIALSLHSFIEFYMKHLFQTSIFSFKQQAMVKAAYPVTVLILLWNMKAFLL